MDAKVVVVIGVDSSLQAEDAIDFYIKFLHKDENQVVLVHIMEMPALHSYQEMHVSAASWDETLHREAGHVKQLEQRLTEKLKHLQIPVKFRAEHGKPGEVIVQIAKELGALEVVVGSRGSGRIRRTILGSVSDYVLHHAHCPVVVCRHHARGQ